MNKTATWSWITKFAIALFIFILLMLLPIGPWGAADAWGKFKNLLGLPGDEDDPDVIGSFDEFNRALRDHAKRTDNVFTEDELRSVLLNIECLQELPDPKTKIYFLRSTAKEGKTTYLWSPGAGINIFNINIEKDDEKFYSFSEAISTEGIEEGSMMDIGSMNLFLKEGWFKESLVKHSTCIKGEQKLYVKDVLQDAKCPEATDYTEFNRALRDQKRMDNKFTGEEFRQILQNLTCIESNGLKVFQSQLGKENIYLWTQKSELKMLNINVKPDDTTVYDATRLEQASNSENIKMVLYMDEKHVTEDSFVRLDKICVKPVLERTIQNCRVKI